ncbi:MAG: hypothetical protein A3C46_04875 [Deltaproteobacteria bacterium RIFCSPHIGHO2_02_FULL_44_16]|nr:MAG: hypothetical protein A3C46_04875 [Deltaproteobacteria bacterium RIFCSPHIGHO2_02_FULL_44_16]
MNDQELTSKVRALLQKKVSLSVPIERIEKLFGDASARVYTRIFLTNGQTFIAMQMPKGNASEEITNVKQAPAQLPFLNIQRFLKERKLPVPQIFAYNAEDALMLLEDLGNTVLAHKVTNVPESTQEEWYFKAIDLLSLFQQKTKERDHDCIAFTRSFDATLLNWEFDHFLEYGLDARGIHLTQEERELFESETRKITEEILQFPTCFTHRDFQSRNLMVRNNELVLIDFQDALLGPAVYDLVALTRDSYISLSKNLLKKLIAYYAQKTKQPEDAVRKHHQLMTVQRKLKDAGRFVYIDQVKKNPHFLSFIPTSLQYVQNALQELPEYKALYELLAACLPEWR